MAISNNAALQMVAQGRMKQSRYDALVKRGKIDLNPTFVPRVQSGVKGLVLVKVKDGMFFGKRFYPVHYKQAPVELSTSKRVEIEAFWEKNKLQVLDKYHDVHFENGKVAVSDNMKRVVTSK